MLNDCTSGDIVTITWPRGSEYGRGRYSDWALGGELVMVQFAGASGALPKGKKNDRDRPLSRVRICDLETHEPDLSVDAFRFVANVEIEDMIQESHVRLNRRSELANERAGDVYDPLQRGESAPHVIDENDPILR